MMSGFERPEKRGEMVQAFVFGVLVASAFWSEYTPTWFETLVLFGLFLLMIVVRTSAADIVLAIETRR